MKIAVVTDDGTTISQHFGRAPYYAVLTIENGEVVAQEQREKPAHRHGPGEQHHEGSHEGAEAGKMHGQMLAPIGDCQVVFARGMGYGAYQSLQQAGIRPMIVDVAGIQDAVRSYLAGTLVDHSERLH